MQQPRGSLAKLFWTLVLCGALLYGVVGVLDPWSFHIGGRWTPLLYWSGSGKLVTKGGTYPFTRFEARDALFFNSPRKIGVLFSYCRNLPAGM